MALNGVTSIELPVIDVTSTDENTAKELIDAVVTHGFVYLKNNNNEIPSANLENIFDLVSLIQA
jgi:hypothetical protein